MVQPDGIALQRVDTLVGNLQGKGLDGFDDKQRATASMHTQRWHCSSGRSEKKWLE